MKIVFNIIKIFFVLLLLTSCQPKYEELNLEIYQYQDTKNLVKFVYDCAVSLQKNGNEQIKYFMKHRDEFVDENYYLYIYKMDGTNVFHSSMPELEGKNLMDIRDINGKEIVKLIREALQNKFNPHAWVHFSWFKPGKFFPVPKSSCHFRVSTNDGTEYFVGGGLDYPHEEKEFIRIIVDTAARMLEQEGLSNLEIIADPLTQFKFREVRTFVIKQNGEILISPVAGNNIFEFNLIECIDEVGHKPFAKAMESLKSNNSTWEAFMAKNPYERFPEKKTMYLKKVNAGKEIVIVGAIISLPQPPWSG
jgi:hypothetical protein